MERSAGRLGPMQWAIIGLTVATAIIHISLAFPDTFFILNGLGYLALLGALYLPLDALQPHRNLARWALLAYTAVTVALWVFLPGAPRGPLAILTKLIEIALIVLLWLEGERARKPS